MFKSRNESSDSFSETILKFTEQSIMEPLYEELASLDKHFLEKKEPILPNEEAEVRVNASYRSFIMSSSASYQYQRYFIPLIIEESRAILKQSIHKIKKEAISASRMSILSTKTGSPYSYRKNNSIKTTFRGNIPLEDLEGATTYIVLQLWPLGSKSAKIGIARLTDAGLLEVEIPQHVYNNNEQYFDVNYKWDVWILGSLVSQARMYDVCSKTLYFPFMEDLSIGKIAALPTDSEKKKYFAIAQTVTDAHGLNPSQSNAVENILGLSTGIQLLQGPPGTGKTTTIVAMAQALVEKKDRVLICAPSNKAAQVIAERLLKKAPGIRIALAGVEKKLNPFLRPIFVHTWAKDRKKELNQIIQQIQSMNLNAKLCEEVGYRNLYGNLNKKLIDIKNEIEDFIEFTHKAIPTLWAYDSLCRSDIENKIKKIEKELLSLNDKICQNEIEQYFINKKKQEAAQNFPELQKANQSKKNSRIKKTPRQTPDVFVQSKDVQSIEQPERLLVYTSRVNGLLTELKILKDKFQPETDLKLLNAADIVICTLSVSGRGYLFQMDKVHTLIVDEAGQAVEAETLIAFQHLKENRPKVLLVGDVNQLPATVFSEKAKKYHYDWSLLERLQVVNQQPHILLNVQYRMAPGIRQWPSQRFYQNQLIDGENIATRPAAAFANDSYISGFKLVDVSGYEERIGKTFYNAAECEAVYNILNYLVIHDYVTPKTTVGVISFYMGQVLELKRVLVPFFDQMALSIGTVDGFQGEECDIIIISAVRANSQNNVGFTDDFRRVNVAVTRPKDSLIVLGNVSTFENQQTDLAALIEDAKLRGKTVFYNQPDFIPMQNPSRLRSMSSTPNIHYSNPAKERRLISSPSISNKLSENQKQSRMVSQYGLYSQSEQNKSEGYVPQIGTHSLPNVIDHNSSIDFPNLTTPKEQKNHLKFNCASTLKEKTLPLSEPANSLAPKKPLSKKQRQLQNKKYQIAFYPSVETPAEKTGNNTNTALNRKNNF